MRWCIHVQQEIADLSRLVVSILRIFLSEFYVTWLDQNFTWHDSFGMRPSHECDMTYWHDCKYSLHFSDFYVTWLIRMCAMTHSHVWYDSSICFTWLIHVLLTSVWLLRDTIHLYVERWGAGVETQKNVRGEIGGWGRVPFNETYAPFLSTIYDGA